MAAIASTRILALQSASPRVIPIPIVLTADTVVSGIGTVGGINTTAVTAHSTANTANATATTANSTANSALSTAQSAQAALTNKLNNSAADVLSGAISVTTAGGFKAGTLTWDSNGNRTGGEGVALTSRGIMGHNGSAATFAIDSSGNATFSGALSAASGTFTGNLTSGGNADVTGYLKATGHTATAGYYASVAGTPSDTSKVGVLGQAGSGTAVAGLCTTGNALYGYASSSGMGVYAASSSGTGVYAMSGSGVAIHAKGFVSHALHVDGSMRKTGTELVANLNADLHDGYHAGNSSGQIPVSNGTQCTNLYANWAGSTQMVYSSAWTYGFAPSTSQPWTGSGTASFPANNKPGGSTSCIWLTVLINGSTYYIPMWS